MGSKVSVIVITHNGKYHLRECFESLEKQTYKDFDAYLLDNASTDGSSDYVKENFPWVKIIRFEKNYGFAEGYNRAIKTVNSKYIALLNDDTKADPRWLEELVKAIESDDKLFAVGSKLLFYDKPNTINHAGGSISPLGGGFDIGIGKDSSKFNNIKYTGYTSGAAMLVQMDVFEEIGGFDKDYFAYCEDSDLCWRAWLYGYKVMYVPTSIVYHKRGGSWNKRKLYYFQRNSITSALKNLQKRNILLLILFYMPYTVAKIIIYAKDRRLDEIKAFNKAIISVLNDIKNILKKRKIIQSRREISDGYLKKQGIILSYKVTIKEYLRLVKIRGD